MRLSQFDFELPETLIAQKPLPQRDQSRMMVIDRSSGKIFHAKFKDLPDYLHKNDVVTLNDSKVIPARIWGKKQEKEIEFLFLREKEPGLWEVLCRPAKKVKAGDIIFFSPQLEGRVMEEREEGQRMIRFSSENVLEELEKTGFAPLPPYIKRKKEQYQLRTFDLERYQTIFAKKQGSIAAPTAGLHFTPWVINRLKKKGMEIVYVTLHVGFATFQPVRVENIKDHQMLEERFSIPDKTARVINQAKQESRAVLAVGTTSVRCLESVAQNKRIQPGTRSTNLFITPGYGFNVVDRLLTNFHLPQSTLLMLTVAFAGHGLIRQAYREAIRLKYRFFSYGDCMLIL